MQCKINIAVIVKNNNFHSWQPGKCWFVLLRNVPIHIRVDLTLLGLNFVQQILSLAWFPLKLINLQLSVCLWSVNIETRNKLATDNALTRGCVQVFKTVKTSKEIEVFCPGIRMKVTCRLPENSHAFRLKHLTTIKWRVSSCRRHWRLKSIFHEMLY